MWCDLHLPGKTSVKYKQFGPFCLNGIITGCSQCEPSFRKGEVPVLGLRSLLQVRCSWPASPCFQASDFIWVYPAGSSPSLSPRSSCAGATIPPAGSSGMLQMMVTSIILCHAEDDRWMGFSSLCLAVMFQFNLHSIFPTFLCSELKEQSPGHLMEGQNAYRYSRCISFLFSLKTDLLSNVRTHLQHY